MRIESSITSLSWIPSENIPGLMKLPFELGPFHFDDPPGDRLPDLAELAASSKIRFANELRAWIDVDADRIIDYGYTGRGWMGITRLKLGRRGVRFTNIPLPDLRPEPVVDGRSVRFIQTTGGRVSVPMPRRVSRPPFLQIAAPLVWTTLALTISADGSSRAEMIGASPFPRHWIYDAGGKLVQKSGRTDFKTWANEIFGQRTPWGSEDSPALVTEVETAIERELSVQIMRGGRKPQVRGLKEGDLLVKQGDPGSELYLLLDGVLAVEVDEGSVAEVGPGAILGERAVLEGGTRTATLRAVTDCRVAVAAGADIAPEALAEVAAGHRREESQ